jgi:hypothetical protein
MKALFVFGVAGLAAGSIAAAKPQSSKLTWGDAPPALPAGAQMAVVSGDPGKAGMFKVDLKMPAGYAVPAHWHPTDEHVRVVSGKLGYGMTAKLDKDHAKWLSPGHSVAMKAKMHHWVFANNPAEIEVSGKGPFQITYVDPKDDPRNK